MSLLFESLNFTPVAPTQPISLYGCPEIHHPKQCSPRFPVRLPRCPNSARIFPQTEIILLVSLCETRRLSNSLPIGKSGTRQHGTAHVSKREFKEQGRQPAIQSTTRTLRRVASSDTNERSSAATPRRRCLFSCSLPGHTFGSFVGALLRRRFIASLLLGGNKKGLGRSLWQLTVIEVCLVNNSGGSD